MGENLESKIKNAYDKLSLSDEARERIADALNGEFEIAYVKQKLNTGVRQVKGKRVSRFISAAAAAVLVVAIGTAAYASDWLGLKGLRLAGETYDDAPAQGQEETLSCEETVDMISLQGMAGSDEYAAASEWNAYVQRWLSESEIDNYYRAEEQYLRYQVYSDEMAEKLDGICEKYGLSLHGAMDVVYQSDAAKVAEFNACIGTDLLFPNNSAVSFSGYWYSEGSFQLDAYIAVPTEELVNVQLRRCMKGVMDDVFLNVANINGEEWTYTTADGVTLGVAMGETHAVIYADSDNAFVLVNVIEIMAGDDGEQTVFTRELLETLAEQINFAAIC